MMGGDVNGQYRNYRKQGSTSSKSDRNSSSTGRIRNKTALGFNNAKKDRSEAMETLERASYIIIHPQVNLAGNAMALITVL